MPDLPAQPDLDQLRHQASDLLRASQRGDPKANARVRAVASRIILSSARARRWPASTGSLSWAKRELEVERRDILNTRDLSRLTRLLAEHPELATRPMEHWTDRQHGEPLGYVRMIVGLQDGRLGLPSEHHSEPRRHPGQSGRARARRKPLRRKGRRRQSVRQRRQPEPTL